MEFVTRTDRAPSEINAALAASGIVGGLDLGRYEPTLANHMLWCATELNDKAAVDRLITALRAI
jgi:glycine dehydrogenase subunit 1